MSEILVSRHSLLRSLPSRLFGTMLLVFSQIARIGAADEPQSLPLIPPLLHLTVASGLGSSVVRNVVQDQAGYFWIATHQGLDRYRESDLVVHFDANNTVLFPDARLTAIAQVPGGPLWLGTYGGLVHYADADFTTFDRRQGLPDDHLTYLLAPAGDRLWLGAWRGLSAYTQGSFASIAAAADLSNTPVLPQSPVSALLQDRSGHLWVGFAVDGLWRHDGRNFTPAIQNRDGYRLKVHTLYEDRRGDLWVGSVDRGLRRFSQQNQKWGPEELAATSVFSLREDHQGGLWAGTSSGLFRRSAQTWKPFPLKSGDPSAISALSADSQQNLWVGTQSDGLWQIRGETCVPVEELAGTQVRAILEDQRQRLWVATDQGLYRRLNGVWDSPLPVSVLPPCPLNGLFEDDQGSLWVGTENQGLLRFSNARITHFHPAHHLPVAAINAQLVTADSILWLGTGGGLVAFDGEQFRPFGKEHGLPHHQVHSLAPAGPGELWIGTGAGLAHLQDGRISTALPDSALPAPAVLSLAPAPDGSLWLGTGAGLVRYQAGRTRVFTTADGLPHDHVRALAVDGRGRLWIATSGGLALFERERFTRFTTADGLTTNLLFSLMIDRDGGLWIGTIGGGALRYDGRQFLRLTSREGLLSNTVRRIIQDRDGHVWLATDKGLTRYHRDDIPAIPRTYSLLFSLVLGGLLLLSALTGLLFLKRRFSASGLLCGLICAAAFQPAWLRAAPLPKIADVQAVQRPGTLWIDITYDLEGTGDGQVHVVVEASDDGGQTYDVPVLSTVGDVGLALPGPDRSILWDAGADDPELFTTPWQVRLLLFHSPPVGDMVRIPAGLFTMGSSDGDPQERPVHPVHLRAFWLDRYETTNRAFMHFVQATGHRTLAELEGESLIYEDGGYRQMYGASWKAPRGAGSYLRNRLDHPVVHIAWKDASAYCAWVGKRLPTEAEWEKAARGTDQRLYPWGDEAPNGGGFMYRANYGTDQCCHESAQDGFLNTAPVGSFPLGVSPYGLHDMAGNVWEWTQDWYSPDYYASSPPRDPSGPPTGTERVLRGGSWISYRFMLRTAYRGHHTGETRHNYSGFRCARD